MKTKLLLVFALLLSLPTFACYNGYEPMYVKPMLTYEKGKLTFASLFYAKSELEEILHDIDRANYKNLPPEPNDELYKETDRGIVLAFLGRYDEAMRMFKAIEKKHPGLYATAANIGTTYELLGKNDSALLWINKAIKINPKSHNGSEWIHVKILEAKIRAAKEKPGFLDGYDVLGLNWGGNVLPVNTSGKDMKELANHLVFQLNERLKFIKPQEPIMARLLFDLGTALYFTPDSSQSIIAYAKAEEFGYKAPPFQKWKRNVQNPKEAQAKYEKAKNDSIAAANSSKEVVEEEKKKTFPWIYVTGGGLIGVAIGLATRRRRKK